MQEERLGNRAILKLTGADRLGFLQDLLTNNIEVPDNQLVYTALLSPQGKYLFDFFLFHRPDATYIDIKASRAPALVERLTMYRLRADVTIAQTDLIAARGLKTGPKDAMPDPRHSALGWRSYHPADQTHPDDEAAPDWVALRVAHMIPETGVDLIPNESYILEMGFERLHGVDFRKGCYVGQEVTARMKHKTELRKGMALVGLDGEATPGSEIRLGGKTIGTLTTVAGDRGLAYLRFDKAGEGMTAGSVGLTLLESP